MDWRAAIVGGLLAGIPALGADPGDVTWRAWDGVPAPEPAWEWGFEPTVWYAGPSGEVRLPGSPPGTPRTDFLDLNLDSPRLSPAGTLSLRGRRWRVSASAFSNSVEGSAAAASAGRVGGVGYSAGERLRSDFTLSSLEVMVGYRLLEARRGQSDHGPRLAFGVEALGGLRAQEFQLEVSAPGGAAGVDEWFVEPVLGGALSVELWGRVGLDLRVTAGGWGGYDGKASGSADITVGFLYKLGDHAAVRIGYRTIFLGLSAGDDSDRFEYVGSSAGLSAGLVVRF